MINGLNCQACYQQRKTLYGCESDVPPYRIEGYQITRCPVKSITGIENDYMQAYLEYKNGYLPNDGGWLNQPMKFTQVMNCLDKLMGKTEKEKNG